MSSPSGSSEVESDLSIVLVRHGRTALNAAGQLRGRADPPLDECGNAEADRLASALSRIQVASVISSPRRRALQTATPIASLHEVAVQVADGLDDRDYGPWTSHSRDEVVLRFGSLDTAPGIEARATFEKRVLSAFHRIAATSLGPDDGLLVLVAHDAVNRVLLARLVESLPDDPALIEQHTGCWNRLELVAGRWQATIVNARPQRGTGADGQVDLADQRGNHR